MAGLRKIKSPAFACTYIEPMSRQRQEVDFDGPAIRSLGQPTGMSPGPLNQPGARAVRRQSVRIGPQALAAALELPEQPRGVVVFASEVAGGHASARSAVRAQVLRAYGFGALLFDLLTEQEALDRRHIIGIPLLGARLSEALDWLAACRELRGMPVGLYGDGSAAAAVLRVAALQPEAVGALVCSDARADFVATLLARVRAPTLLLVGAREQAMLEPINQLAMRSLTCDKRLELLPRARYVDATGEPPDVIVSLAGHWFEQHLTRFQH